MIKKNDSEDLLKILKDILNARFKVVKNRMGQRGL